MQIENLIPFEQFSGPAGIAALVAILVVCLVVLSKGAAWFVEGAAQLAYRLGIFLLALLASYTIISVPWAKAHPNLAEEQLNFIMDRLNNRPRKTLGFKTPNEVFCRHLT